MKGSHLKDRKKAKADDETHSIVEVVDQTGSQELRFLGSTTREKPEPHHRKHEKPSENASEDPVEKKSCDGTGHRETDYGQCRTDQVMTDQSDEALASFLRLL